MPHDQIGGAVIEIIDGTDRSFLYTYGVGTALRRTRVVRKEEKLSGLDELTVVSRGTLRPAFRRFTISARRTDLR